MTWAACMGLNSACMRHIVVKGGGSRLPNKRREAWRLGPFTERGRGVVFKASTPMITGWGEVTSPVASVPHACHVVLTRSGW